MRHDHHDHSQSDHHVRTNDDDNLRLQRNNDDHHGGLLGGMRLVLPAFGARRNRLEKDSRQLPVFVPLSCAVGIRQQLRNTAHRLRSIAVHDHAAHAVLHGLLRVVVDPRSVGLVDDPPRVLDLGRRSVRLSASELAGRQLRAGENALCSGGNDSGTRSVSVRLLPDDDDHHDDAESHHDDDHHERLPRMQVGVGQYYQRVGDGAGQLRILPVRLSCAGRRRRLRNDLGAVRQHHRAADDDHSGANDHDHDDHHHLESDDHHHLHTWQRHPYLDLHRQPPRLLQRQHHRRTRLQSFLEADGKQLLRHTGSVPGSADAVRLRSGRTQDHLSLW